MARKEPPQELAECSSCGAKIPADAKECPQCGEVFSEDLLEEAGEGAKGGRRERLLFYLGLVLILIGGPGMALGSVLHDSLKISIIGNAFDAFGWLNRIFAAVGLVILIVGIVFLILSARLTSRSTESEYDVGSPGQT